ncbi:hypothetical protein CI109_103445 [Kwoniella shandongensis]|uniref:Uncharacterized protein n=1 Tax=Kwoniella shandongensis TaxID=1734106 RepID=A0A5M6BZH3_9TREE|nr:uncharacterized protein CI109_004525 [Kwoniella shandongensis]KAA5527232.1 hypothetical protein CI109_004525 [Kwoniella shandongensis]
MSRDIDGASGLRHLSLNPPPPIRKPSRESTLESVGQAVDIFDLYGVEDGTNGGAGERDSWPVGGHKEEISTEGDAGGLQTPTDGEGRISISTASWEGPMGALALGRPISEDQERRPSSTARRGQEEGRERWSHNDLTPDISITDTSPPVFPQTPTRKPPPPSSSPVTDPHLHTGNSSRANSPVHPSITRLSPRHASTLNSSVGSGSRQSSMISDGTRTSVDDDGYGDGDGEGNRSQVSVAGSAQYPGEENDAFHVRSTYARLDNEGVHGDGWDPGVERTRGGPSTGKRATVFEASKTGDVGEQERQFLASLDRYGFINEPLRNRSETRLALIPSSPLTKVPKLPSISPLAGKPAAEPISSFMPSADPGPSARIPQSPRMDGNGEERLRQKESERVGKWGKMMSVKNRDKGGNINEWEWRTDGQGAKLPRRVYKGIPDRWRMAAWWTLAEERTREYKGKGKEKRAASEMLTDYHNTIDLPSTFDVQIDLDVPRTISGHTMFVTRYGTGQRNLWHVLHCFSQVCESCGYVQGMGPIAATLLCYFDPERAYALLVRLHDVYGMHDIFEPGFPGLLEAFYVQERLMEWLMPDLYQSFQRNMISSSAWGTKWYITLFVNTVPFSQQLRLWDAMWLDGRDVMIMTSVAILWAFRDLLSAKNATFESILSLLSSYFVAEDEDVMMRWIRKMLNQPGTKTKMDAWRAEWHVLVKEGKSGTALL